MPDWVDDDEDETVREEGTACHWSAHQNVISGQRVPVGHMAPNNVPISEEMHDAHDMYFSAVREWGVSQAYFELPVICRRISQFCGGTLDVGAYDPERKTIFVGDLKFGFRFVDVRNNWQLLCYAVGLQDYFGIASDVDLWFDFLIVQPRSYHREGPVRRWKVHATEIRPLINQLTNAASLAMSHNPSCYVNNGCNRCPGRSRCVTLQNAALGALEDSHLATPHDLPFLAAEDELRRLRAARAYIEARITGLEQQVTYGMRKGSASRHFALEQEAGRLIWKEGAEAIISNIAKLYGVEINTNKIITPTQAMKKLPPAFVAQHAHRPMGGVKLVNIESSKVGRKLGK